MNKGDIKTRKGKIFNGSYGVKDLERRIIQKKGYLCFQIFNYRNGFIADSHISNDAY
jgi:ribosomal small subunit protein bTHX